VRILSATNCDLMKAVQDAKFRKDLYYRLNVVPIHLPPLRERKEDIPLLISHFVGIFNRVFKKDIQGIDQAALAYLIKYPWPGNIRELKNIMERLTALKDNGAITTADLPLDIFIQCDTAGLRVSAGTLKDASNNFQKHYIEAVLERVKGNQSRAAKIMGIHRNALHNKLLAWGTKK
jgi:transcriptional regulator with PAS, ATPase and Fis domain